MKILKINKNGSDRDEPDFFQEVEEHYEELDSNNVIQAGEWKLAFFFFF